MKIIVLEVNVHDFFEEIFEENHTFNTFEFIYDHVSIAKQCLFNGILLFFFFSDESQTAFLELEDLDHL